MFCEHGESPNTQHIMAQATHYIAVFHDNLYAPLWNFDDKATSALVRAAFLRHDMAQIP